MLGGPAAEVLAGADSISSTGVQVLDSIRWLCTGGRLSQGLLLEAVVLSREVGTGFAACYSTEHTLPTTTPFNAPSPMHQTPLDPLEVLDNATSVVPTENLERQGVDQIRVLSQSQFVEIVRTVVEDFVSQQLSEEAPELTLGDCGPHDRKLASEFERRWDLLRSKHGMALRKIERRMGKLSRVFATLEEKLQQWEDGVPSPSVSASAVEARSVDKKTLLREMLLDEE